MDCDFFFIEMIWIYLDDDDEDDFIVDFMELEELEQVIVMLDVLKNIVIIFINKVKLKIFMNFMLMMRNLYFVLFWL